MTGVPQPRADEVLAEGTLLSRVWYRWVLALTNRVNATTTSLATLAANVVVLTARVDGAPVLPEYTVTTLPVATGDKRLIYVSNESGGAVVAFNDGTNWRRLTDRAVVS